MVPNYLYVLLQDARLSTAHGRKSTPNQRRTKDDQSASGRREPKTHGVEPAEATRTGTTATSSARRRGPTYLKVLLQDDDSFHVTEGVLFTVKAIEHLPTDAHHAHSVQATLVVTTCSWGGRWSLTDGLSPDCLASPSCTLRSNHTEQDLVCGRNPCLSRGVNDTHVLSSLHDHFG